MLSGGGERRRAHRGQWRAYPPEDGRAHTVAGSVRVMERFWSPQLGNQRDLLVYLPPSYARGRRRYPVVYMHDGQNLFDQATSFGEEWQVDETMEAAAAGGVEAIVVGIPNMGDARLDEYSPWHDAESGGGGRADAYLDLLLETIKPVVDRDFRTLPGREHTAVAGSSMGGLVSLYAYFRRPDAFGAAGVMSPALWFAGGQVFPFVEQAPFVPGRLYLDIGTNEGKTALEDARRMRDLLEAKGYRRGEDFLYVTALGGRHSERAWRRRTRRMMHFLLGIAPPAVEPPRRAG